MHFDLETGLTSYVNYNKHMKTIPSFGFDDKYLLLFKPYLSKRYQYV